MFFTRRTISEPTHLLLHESGLHVPASPRYGELDRRRALYSHRRSRCAQLFYLTSDTAAATTVVLAFLQDSGFELGRAGFLTSREAQLRACPVLGPYAPAV
ncbi:unnamed protein product [Laminaria digitata]